MTKDGKETDLWAEVTPEMMSDEELEGGVYVRHQPSHRSDTLNAFIKKLDSRLDARCNNSKVHPRSQRRLGSPRDKPIPKLTKRWVIKKQRRRVDPAEKQVPDTHDQVPQQRQMADNNPVEKQVPNEVDEVITDSHQANDESDSPFDLSNSDTDSDSDRDSDLY